MSDEIGYAVIPNWLLRDGTVDEKVKILYLLIASRMGRNGACWPSQALMAEELGVDARTIRRHLVTLQEMNLVTVTAVKTPTGRRNTYHLVSDPFGGVAKAMSAPPQEPAETGGGEDTSVLMGEDTSVLRIRTTRTREREEVPSPEVPVGRAAVESDPVQHPSRQITPGWTPRTAFIAGLRRDYPRVNLQESCRRFVDYQTANQRTSRSWEASFRQWVSNDAERLRERHSGTDELGVPYGQKRGSVQDLPQPGDEGYVSPEDLAREAVEMAKRRPPKGGVQ